MGLGVRVGSGREVGRMRVGRGMRLRIRLITRVRIRVSRVLRAIR